MKKYKRYRVRFHLAKGDNHMKWQVFDRQENTKDYFDPNSKSIVMFSCQQRRSTTVRTKQFALGWLAMMSISRTETELSPLL